MSTKHYKLIIFDLDGTLTPERPSSAAPFERRLLPGVKEKCRELQHRGKILAVATNQKNVDPLDFFAHLHWIRGEVGFSLYRWATEPEYMKPNPNMIRSLFVESECNSLRQVLMIGDSIDDHAAAIVAGVDFEWAKDFFGWATMPCGHDDSAIVGSDDGTCYCGECEKEAENNGGMDL